MTWILLLVLCLLLVAVKGNEPVCVDSPRKASSIPVTVHNSLDLPVDVTWFDGLDKSTILRVDAQATEGMTSYVGHKFFVTPVGSDAQYALRVHEFTIRDGIFHYEIPQVTNPSVAISNTVPAPQKVHPQVVLMNSISTSVGARFKSLYPKSLIIYYEDHRGGSEQGILRPGRETTTNTYQGHVFFFREKDDPSHEVARITITKDKVHRPELRGIYAVT